MIVDLDAHQGNGHERDHINDPDTFIMDCYNHRIYPNDKYAKQAISSDLKVTYTMSDQDYIEQLDQELENAIERFAPEFVVYNAGTDCLINDPLGCLGVSAEGIIQRD